MMAQPAAGRPSLPMDEARQLYHDACARRTEHGRRADFAAVFADAQRELAALLGVQAIKPVVVGRGRGGNYRTLTPCPRCGRDMNARAGFETCWRCRQRDARQGTP